MKKIFSVAAITLVLALIISISCDKDKKESIVGPGEDTYTILGKVVTFTGYGRKDITVTLIGAGVEDTTITDSSGDYSFDGLTQGNYTIIPLKEG